MVSRVADSDGIRSDSDSSIPRMPTPTPTPRIPTTPTLQLWWYLFSMCLHEFVFTFCRGN